MCLCDNAPLRLTDANDITVYHNWARAIFCLFEIPSDFYILLSQILKDYHNAIKCFISWLGDSVQSWEGNFTL